ncbi:MAG: Multidrug resistance protein MdtA [Candidatus Omnitrophica bacterium]|nr:Multidrug resistance protein MdtA [Candidatus Omnitrophota bacterium]
MKLSDLIPFKRKKSSAGQADGPDVTAPARKKGLPKKKLFTLVAALMAATLLYSFVKDRVTCVGGFPVFKKAKKTEEKKVFEEIPVPVKVYKIARVSFRDTLPALGTIKGFREFALKFAVNGNIEYINFKEGERITQGDIIASLDQKEALLKLEYAKIELDKQSKLFELGSIIEGKLKQSQLEYQSAKAELDKTNLIAVSDGYIGSLEVEKGSFVTPQDRVGTFVDMKDVYIEFGVIEKDIAKVKEGQNVEMTADSYPDQLFKGQIDSISPLVEGRSRTVKVRSKIANPDEKVKPGMFGRVNTLVYEKEQALVIPASSFKKKEDQHFVYLVHPQEEAPEPAAGEEPSAPKDRKRKKDAPAAGAGPEGDAMIGPEEPKQSFGLIEVRNIEIEYATPDAIEVKEGLEEGDLVVVDIDQELKDKAKVEITETQEGIF